MWCERLNERLVRKQAHSLQRTQTHSWHCEIETDESFIFNNVFVTENRRFVLIDLLASLAGFFLLRLFPRLALFYCSRIALQIFHVFPSFFFGFIFSECVFFLSLSFFTRFSPVLIYNSTSSVDDKQMFRLFFISMQSKNSLSSTVARSDTQTHKSNNLIG